MNIIPHYKLSNCWRVYGTDEDIYLKKSGEVFFSTETYDYSISDLETILNFMKDKQKEDETQSKST